MRKRRLCALLVVTQLEAMASQVESGLTGVQGNGAQMLNAGEEADYREQGFLNAAPTAAACPPGPRGGAQSWAEGRRKLRGPGRQGLRAPAPLHLLCYFGKEVFPLRGCLPGTHLGVLGSFLIRKNKQTNMCEFHWTLAKEPRVKCAACFYGTCHI